MSLRSMTGYGRGEASARGIKVEVELSSVNRKQTDINLSVPRSLAVLQPQIEEEIHKTISRGRITGEVAVLLSRSARQRSVRVDEDLARTYVTAIRKTARRLKLRDDLGTGALLQLPDVVRFEQTSDAAETIWPILEDALGQALRHLLRMRRREGARLQQDLEKRFANMARRVARIGRQAPRVMERYRRKLQARLKAAGFTVAASDDRLLRELAFFAERSDITEEITRLDSHLRQAKKLLQSEQPAGRSLDFIAQEMFRETNTVGSKANDAAIMKDVVALKAELERVREQVQNIE